MTITKGAGATATNVTFSGSVPNHQTTLGIGSAVTATSGLTAVVCSWATGGGAHTITASDSVNGAWAAADKVSSVDAYGDQVAILSFPNAAAGTPTITIKSGTATTVAGSIAFTEWIGMATSAHKDVSSSAQASGTTGSSGDTAATAVADSVAIAGLANGNGNTTLTENAAGTTGTYTLLVEHENGSVNVQSSIVYRILSATGTQGHRWTQTSETYTGAIQVYKGGASGMTSTAAGTFPGFSGTASGQHPFISTAAGTLPGFSGAATGAQAHTATAAGTLPGFSGSATGAQVHTATATGTFPGLNGAATGAQTHAATAAGTFPSFSGAATGTHSASGAADGTGVGTLPSFSGAATGAFPFTSTAAGTFPTFDGAAVALQTHTATAVGTFPSFDGSATAAMLPAATAAGTFPSFSGSASGVFGVLVLTPLKGTMLIDLYLSGSAHVTPYLDGGMEVQGP